MEVLQQRLQGMTRARNNQLKTGNLSFQSFLISFFFPGLAYDPAMAKHQCLCGENQRNHVEHGVS